jgi:hypothetical protein
MPEGSSMLLGWLGIIIAFSSVMLLLSLLVTSLAQFTQAGLRLRARNLQRALTSILATEHAEPAKKARQLLNAPQVALIKRRPDPNSLLSRILGPVVSWVDPETLGKALTYPNSKVVERFRESETFLRKRFGWIMKIVAFAWAVIVAAAFQVSAPDLLHQLSADPELVARYAAAAPGLVESGQSATAQLSDDTSVARAALDQLVEAHPELRSQLEGINRAASHPEEISEQLEAVVEQAPNREAIIEEYEGLVSAQLEKQREVALAEARRAIDQLGGLSITPWRDKQFFLSNGKVRFDNILGVLTTAILLSLGAPFWFNVLKTGISYRDLLKPAEASSGGEGTRAAGAGDQGVAAKEGQRA